MLRLRLEIVPFGNELEAKQIGQLIIGNVTGSGEYADYHAWFDDDPRGQDPRPEPHARIKDHRRVEGAWSLVRRVLSVKCP